MDLPNILCKNFLMTYNTISRKSPCRIPAQNSHLLLCAVAGEHSFSIRLLIAGPACRDAGLQAGPGNDRAFDGGDTHVPAEDRRALGLLQVISGVVLLRQGGLLIVEAEATHAMAVN